jgi:hypothetical protein
VGNVPEESGNDILCKSLKVLVTSPITFHLVVESLIVCSLFISMEVSGKAYQVKNKVCGICAHRMSSNEFEHNPQKINEKQGWRRLLHLITT